MNDKNGRDDGALAPGAKEVLSHAWDWFSLHAGQRMQAVNFFLVAAAFLFNAFVVAVRSHNFAVSLGISVFGMLASLVFSRLEARARELLHAAEHAIAPIEALLASSTNNQFIKLTELVATPAAGIWAYSRSFRWLFRATGLTCVAGAIYSLWQLGDHLLLDAASPCIASCTAAVSFVAIGAWLIAWSPLGDPPTAGTVMRCVFAVFIGALLVIAGVCVVIITVEHPKA